MKQLKKMNESANKWGNKYGIKFFEDIGVKTGDRIFDCFCGEGNFSIPAAKVAGQGGLVYALEMNDQKLNVLKSKSRLENLKNIKIIHSEFKTDIPLPDKSIDIVLLYDIFLYFSPDDDKLKKLLNEIYRISKDSAIISAYPEHIDKNELEQTMKDKNFIVEKEFSKVLVHDNKIKKGHIMNFRKINIKQNLQA